MLDDLIVEVDETVDTEEEFCVLLEVLFGPSTFPSSVIALCRPPRSCLTAAAADVMLLAEEDDCEDIICVEDELSTCLVVVLVEELEDEDCLEVLLLLRLLLSKCSCDVVIELVDNAPPSVPDVVDVESGAFGLAKRLWRIEGVGEPVSAMSDIDLKKFFRALSSEFLFIFVHVSVGRMCVLVPGLLCTQTLNT